VAFIVAARELGWGGMVEAMGAALALVISLGLASLLKARLLGSILGQKISSWRWALVWAAGPAVGVGVLARFLPEWAELGLGIPAILGIYGLVIWRRGFGPEDRVLFRKHKN
jgi:hypothetical protein